MPGRTWTEDDIVRAHRLGQVSQSGVSNKPRPLIARLKLWQDKVLVVVANKTAREHLRRIDVTVLLTPTRQPENISGSFMSLCC